MNDVRDRTVSLVTDLENTIEKPALVVLSSHGDTLQILQTYFMNIPPTEHRQLVGITNAEVREMKLGAPGFELLFRELTEEEFEQLSEEEKEEYLAKKEAAEKAEEEESVEPAENNNSDDFIELSAEEFEALSEDDKQKYLDRKKMHLVKFLMKHNVVDGRLANSDGRAEIESCLFLTSSMDCICSCS